MKQEQPPGESILIVEDEESLAIGLEFNLHEEGFNVTRVADGRAAIEMHRERVFDLIVLDLMLPYLDGFAVAEEIRKLDPQVPILMLTARSSQEDKVRGLESGADDYMTKPFHLGEFILRIRGMLKRKGWYRALIDEDRSFRKGSLAVDFVDLTGKSGTRNFSMTPLEAALLRYFIEHEGRVISKEELLSEVWGISSGVETRTVENFVVRLRKHIEEQPSRPRLIQTVRGAGYRFRVSEK